MNVFPNDEVSRKRDEQDDTTKLNSETISLAQNYSAIISLIVSVISSALGLLK